MTTTLKTSNVANYRLVRAAFAAFCKRKGYTPSASGPHFEHGQFWCFAQPRDEEADLLNFSAVDSECAVCRGRVPCCASCGSCNGIAFEEV